MDPQLAALVKEEVVRNILKTHDRLMVIGRKGTGKTSSALSAAKTMGTILYFSKEGEGAPMSGEGEIVSASSLHELNTTHSSCPAVIIDGINALDKDERKTVQELLSQGKEGQKILIIADTVFVAHEYLRNIDAVVRIKEEAAELLFSTLLSPDFLKSSKTDRNT